MNKHEFKCTMILTEEQREQLKRFYGAPDNILDVTYHKGIFPESPVETIIIHGMTFKFQELAIAKDGEFVARYKELPAP